MGRLETRNFPHSDIEVTIVRKADIIKTIEKNITDVDVAMELISHIEISAEKTLRNHGWAGYPYLGSIRVPPGLSPETLNRNREAKEWAYENLGHREYLMFMKQCAYDAHAINKYRAYFNTIATRQVNKHKKEYSIMCSNKGHNYSVCYFAFRYNIKAVKQEYEYWNEILQENEQKADD